VNQTSAATAGSRTSRTSTKVSASSRAITCRRRWSSAWNSAEPFASSHALARTAGSGELVRRAHEAIRSAPIGAVPRVTVSVGLCDAAHAGSAAEVLRLADGALAWAKAQGRDGVCMYTPSGPEALSAAERAERLARSQALVGLRALARAIDAKDTSTMQHSERVADLARRLALGRGWEPGRAAMLAEVALVHDVGKIGVPDAVLLKPGRLTYVEYEVVKEHAALGAQITSEILAEEQVSWLRGHHERFDGGGYPDGLAGEAIPEGARLLAMVDSYDAMTASRSYCARLAPEALQDLDAAITELRGLRSTGAVLGLLDVDDEFFVLLRPVPGGIALLLSDAVAALDYDVAADVLDLLRVELPPDDDALDDPWPEGDLTILADLGLPADELELLAGDLELYPDEQLAAIGRRCGFADELAEVVEVADRPGD